jgi:hypothetical protein
MLDGGYGSRERLQSPSLFNPWRHLDHCSRQTPAPVVGGVLGQVEHKPHRAFTAYLLKPGSVTFNIRTLYCVIKVHSISLQIYTKYTQ